MNTHVRIHKITRETQVIYTLWSCFIVLVVAYVGLIAATMVYGVERRAADTAARVLTQQLADEEARFIAESSALTEVDAFALGLTHLDTRLAVSGDVRIGLAAR
jgi:hypothetical protein